MIVYEARYYGGEYEDKFDNSLGIYDDLQVAEWECLQAMELFQKSTWEDIDYMEHKETRCFYINEWKVNIGMLERNVRVWHRRKDGKFFDIPDTDKDEEDEYDPWADKEEEK